MNIQPIFGPSFDPFDIGKVFPLGQVWQQYKRGIDPHKRVNELSVVKTQAPPNSAGLQNMICYLL